MTAASGPESEQAENLERRTFNTYQSRLYLEKRLRKRESVWNFLLITTTIVVSLSSIAVVARPSILGQGDLLLVLVSILAAFLSIVVSSLRLSERARDAFHAYRAIQAVSVRAERLKRGDNRAGANSSDLETLQAEYDSLLNSTENHSSEDYYWATLASNQSKSKEDRIPISIWQVLGAMRQSVQTYSPLILLAPSAVLGYLVVSGLVK